MSGKDIYFDLKPASGRHNQGILKQGYLLKRSDVLKKWNIRYFVLTKECLCYYRSEQESKENAPKELIFFNDMSLYIDELREKETKYCIKIVKRSLSHTVAASRIYTLCTFSEDERNEWLSQILLAKAMTLVVDPTSWINNEETSTKDLDFALQKPSYEVRFASAKEIFQRCRRTLSLGRNLHHAPSCMSVYDFNANKNITMNLHWTTKLLTRTSAVLS